MALRPQEQIRPQPPAPDLIYAFAPLKHARLDYMVQKAVEMGAGVLQPVLTQRTQAARVNHERMTANAVEAAEQCGVLHVPEVRVFCDEAPPGAEAVTALRAGPGDGEPPALGLRIGPEGGFDPREREALTRLPRVVRLSLGPRILRADTAAVAALAVVQAVLGDWRNASSA